MSGRLAGKVAIVTGASPNIGGTIASGFAAEGARVACNDLRPAVRRGAGETDRGGRGHRDRRGGRRHRPGRVSALVERVLGRWGQVDVLVNNAVRFNTKGVLDMPVEEFRQQVDVILGGAFLMTQAVARSMADRAVRGSIINILSTAAWQGQAGNIGYCTAKSGMINFTRSAAMELAPHGIRVNGFTPTATMPDDTELAARFAAPPRRARSARAWTSRVSCRWADCRPRPTTSRARLPRVGRVGHDNGHEHHRRRWSVGEVLAASADPARRGTTMSGAFIIDDREEGKFRVNRRAMIDPDVLAGAGADLRSLLALCGPRQRARPTARLPGPYRRRTPAHLLPER